jgi:hypothetical protein
LAPGNYGTIPRPLWMITEAEKGHFGLEYAGILILYPSAGRPATRSQAIDNFLISTVNEFSGW